MPAPPKTIPVKFYNVERRLHEAAPGRDRRGGQAVRDADAGYATIGPRGPLERLRSVTPKACRWVTIEIML
jgi:hypothetical protein